MFIYQPAPQYGKHYEYPPICSIDSPKVGWLERGNDSVEEKDKASYYSKQEALIISQPEPY
jgi:hypothetical protein